MTTISPVERFNIPRRRLHESAAFLGNMHGVDVFGHTGEHSGAAIIFYNELHHLWVMWGGQPDGSTYGTRLPESLRVTGLTAPQLQEIVDFCVARAKLLA